MVQAVTSGAGGTQECDVLRLQRDGANLDLSLRKSALENLTVAQVDTERGQARVSSPSNPVNPEFRETLGL